MYLHAHAKVGPAGRLALVHSIAGGCSIREAAASFRVSPATAHRWWQRWRSASDRERAIRDCRRQTGWGPRLVAGATGFAHSSVRKVLHRFGLSRPPRAQREPANSSRRGFARRTESIRRALLLLRYRRE